jgi:hypothetical protein
MNNTVTKSILRVLNGSKKIRARAVHTVAVLGEGWGGSVAGMGFCHRLL